LPKRNWRKKADREEWSPGVRVSEQEQLNRVILTKALQVCASNETLHLKTEDEDFEITPRVASDVMKVSGNWPAKKLRQTRKSKK
jgi:hypothetical protein